MALTDLLDRPLKSAELIELLEMNDAEVIYDFDRLQEGTPDSYRVSLPAEGLELVFDSSQRLEVVFVSLENDPELAEGLPQFESPGQAADFATSHSLPFTEGRADFQGVERVWIRLEYAGYFAHYEYRSSQLAQITLTRRNP